MIYFNLPAAQSGDKVTITDDRLASVFGPCYEWSEGLAEIIEGMIQTDEVIRVANARALWALIDRDYLHAEYLNLRVAPLSRYGPVAITMTGNRGSDAAAADAELARQLGYLPNHDGFTWHHEENIWQEGGRWKCRMYLVDSGYHRRHPHRGGVYKYELFNPGRSYT